MHSKNIKYIPALDHLRFYAALLIVIFHLANGHFVHYMHFDIGVPLFFTLSGYLFFTIAYQKRDEEIIYWRFLYNRALRIYPLITLLFLMTVVIMNKFTALDFINLLGLNLPGKERDSWIIGDWGYQFLSFNWWTVGVEFIYYMLFPFIFKFYRKYGVKYLIQLLSLIVVLKFCLFEAFLNEYGWKKLAISFNYSFFTNFDIFIIGMIAAHYRHVSSTSPLFSVSDLGAKILFPFYVIVMWYILINFIDKTPIPISTSLNALLCSGLIILYQEIFRTTKENRLTKSLSSLGTISFSVYLLHDFIKTSIHAFGVEEKFMGLFSPYITSADTFKFVSLILYVPIILVISSLAYNIIEKPFLDLRVKYFKKTLEQE